MACWPIVRCASILWACCGIGGAVVGQVGGAVESLALANWKPIGKIHDNANTQNQALCALVRVAVANICQRLNLLRAGCVQGGNLKKCAHICAHFRLSHF